MDKIVITQIKENNRRIVSRVAPRVRGRLPLNLKNSLRPVGKVVIDAEICKGCGFCIEFCPQGILEFSDKINKQGYQYPRVKPGMENLCVDCGMCERVCPELAIQVYEADRVPPEVVTA